MINNYIDNIPNEIIYHISSYLNPIESDGKTYRDLASLALCDKKRFVLVNDYILHSKVIHLDPNDFATAPHIPAKKIKLKESKKICYIEKNPRHISDTSVLYWTAGKICFKNLKNDSKEFIDFPKESFKNSHFILNGLRLIAQVKNSNEITIHQPIRKKGSLLPKFSATTYQLPGVVKDEKIGKIHASSADSKALLTLETETRTLYGFHLELKKSVKIELKTDLERVGITDDYFFYQQRTHSQLKIHFFKEINNPYTIHLTANDSVIHFTEKKIYFLRKVNEVQSIYKINTAKKTESSIKITEKIEGMLKIRPIDERYAVLIEINNIQRAFHLRVLDFELGEVREKQTFGGVVKYSLQPQPDESLNKIQHECGKDRVVFIKETPRRYRDYEGYSYQVNTVKFKTK